MSRIDAVRSGVNPPLLETNIAVVILKALLQQRAWPGNRIHIGDEAGHVHLRGAFSVEQVARALAQHPEVHGHLYGMRRPL